jgi:hypothetical protein
MKTTFFAKRLLMRIFLSVVLILLFFQSKSYAQTPRNNGEQLHSELKLTAKFSDRFNVSLVGLRRDFLSGPRLHHTFLPFIHAQYALNEEWGVAQGFTNAYWAFPEGKNRPISYRYKEYRPHQSVHWKKKKDGNTVSWRLMVEERWLQNANAAQTAVINDYRFSLRYRTQWAVSLLIKKFDNAAFHVLGDGEVFFSSVNSRAFFFDQTRFSASCKMTFAKKSSISLGYMHWFQQSSSYFISRDILMLQLAHTLDFRKN